MEWTLLLLVLAFCGPMFIALVIYALVIVFMVVAIPLAFVVSLFGK